MFVDYNITLLSFEQPSMSHSICQNPIAKGQWLNKNGQRKSTQDWCSYNCWHFLFSGFLDLKYWLGRYNRATENRTSNNKKNFHIPNFASDLMFFSLIKTKRWEGSKKKALLQRITTFPVSHLVLKSEWPQTSLWQSLGWHVINVYT